MGLLDWMKGAEDIRIKAEQASAKARGSSLYDIRLTPQQERDLDRMMRHQATEAGKRGK